MKNIIVTGGSGFVGSNFVKKIVNYNFNVINIDKLTYASNNKYLEKIKNKKNYFFYKKNIIDTKSIIQILKKHPPLYLFNFAAESHVDNSINEPAKFLKTNIFGTYSLLNSIAHIKNKLDKKFKFIQISTDEVFGDVIKKIEGSIENDFYNPSSPYSASKASADHLVTAWGRTFNIPYNITYSCNNYGPNQNKEKFIPVIIKNAIKKKKIPIYGNGKQIRDWIYVEDNISAILDVALFGKKNEKYNIGRDNLFTNNQLVKLILNILINKFGFNKQILGLVEHVKDRPGHDLKYKQNYEKIKKLGWSPDFNIISGLEKTIQFYL